MDAKRFVRLAGAVTQIPGVTLQAMKLHHGNMFGVLRKLSMSLRQRYLPAEALDEGLLDPSLPDQEFDRHCSRSSIAKLQRQRNPMAWEALLADKSVFYRYCIAAGIPVPPLSAIFSRHTPGWTCTGKLLARREEWESYFKRECPPDIVIKPNRGVYGFGIRFLRRNGEQFLNPAGESFSPGEIYDALMADRSFDMFVIQERLRNHPEIEHFNGSDALHTIRMITVLRPDGTCDLPFVKYKVIGGNHYVDNFRHGHLGNIAVAIDMATGALREVISSRGNSTLLHPKTGQPFAGFRIPFWQEAVAAAKSCALKFSPIGTVGWDVAVTPTGPVIIEGNIWYDPPSPADVRPILSALSMD